MPYRRFKIEIHSHKQENIILPGLTLGDAAFIVGAEASGLLARRGFLRFTLSTEDGDLVVSRDHEVEHRALGLPVPEVSP